MYKAKGGSSTDNTSSNEEKEKEKNVYIYILFRHYTKNYTNSTLYTNNMLSPRDCNTKYYTKFNKCKKTTLTGRNWYPTLIEGLEKIQAKYANIGILGLNGIKQLNQLTEKEKINDYWDKLQELYAKGQEAFNNEIGYAKETIEITEIVNIDYINIDLEKQDPYKMNYTYKKKDRNGEEIQEETKSSKGTVEITREYGQNQERQIKMIFYDLKKTKLFEKKLSEQEFSKGEKQENKIYYDENSFIKEYYNEILFNKN
tara:strand:- start:1410 stop:2180 length:771 start_codon:yes stop_codon:yes gene_type:complete